MIEVNDTACRSLGYERDELMTMHVADIEMKFDLEDIRKNWRALVQGQAITMEGEHRRKDGETFPVEVRLAGLRDGGEIKIVALARDVTERKRRQEKHGCSRNNWPTWRGWPPWGNWPPVSPMN